MTCCAVLESSHEEWDLGNVEATWRFSVEEVISRGSLSKDTKRLPPLYANAGIRELWQLDARGQSNRFTVFHLTEARYAEAAPDGDGFRHSRALARSIRARRRPGPVEGTWVYMVDERDPRS